MTQPLKTLAALPEDPSSVAYTHTEQLTATITLAPGHWTAAHMWHIQRHIYLKVNKCQQKLYSNMSSLKIFFIQYIFYLLNPKAPLTCAEKILTSMLNQNSKTSNNFTCLSLCQMPAFITISRRKKLIGLTRYLKIERGAQFLNF